MFYAVKNGREKGIFFSEDACLRQVQDYPNPEYDIFTKIQDAYDYIFEDKIKETKENLEGQLVISEENFNYYEEVESKHKIDSPTYDDMIFDDDDFDDEILEYLEDNEGKTVSVNEDVDGQMTFNLTYANSLKENKNNIFGKLIASTNLEKINLINLELEANFNYLQEEGFFNYFAKDEKIKVYTLARNEYDPQNLVYSFMVMPNDKYNVSKPLIVAGKLPYERLDGNRQNSPLQNTAVVVLAIESIKRALGVSSGLDIEVVNAYEGVGSWVSGSWQAKSPAAKDYVEYMSIFLKNGNNFSFEQITSKHNDVIIIFLEDVLDEIEEINAKDINIIIM